MSSWTDSFLQQALSSVPDPVYRRRVEAELADHLDEMATDLMEAGYSPREARAAALSHMGDPRELAAQYCGEWLRRLRSPRYRVARAGYFFNLACYLLLVAGTGILYLGNTPNFGKWYVGLYGAAAVPMAFILLLILAVPKEDRGWRALEYGCWAYMSLQVPPLLCWFLYLDRAFEFSGVLVCGAVGALCHLLLLLWGAANAKALAHMRYCAGAELL